MRKYYDYAGTSNEVIDLLTPYVPPEKLGEMYCHLSAVFSEKHAESFFRFLNALPREDMDRALALFLLALKMGGSHEDMGIRVFTKLDKFLPRPLPTK